MEPNTEIQDDLELDIQKAISVIKADNTASPAHLQRKLKLSYGRALQILGHLERRGIVGPAQGSQPRAIHLERLEQIPFEVQAEFEESQREIKKLSSALPSVPETPRITPQVADGKVSNPTQDRPPEPLIKSADVSVLTKGGDENATSENILRCPITAGVQHPAQNTGPITIESIRLGIFAYLPPVRFNTLAFLENLKRNPPAHELVTFSDTPDFNGFKPTVLLEVNKPIEETFPDLKDAKHGFANFVFYLAFLKAWKSGFTHFVLLEADVRVSNRCGNYPDSLKWDGILLEQFKNAQAERNVELILGGSMMLENPFRADVETKDRALALLEKWNPNLGSRDPKERNKPIVCRAQRGSKDKTSMIGCNGAGAIYSVAGLRSLFPEIKNFSGATETIATLAKDAMAYDFEIAKRLWQKHKAAAFDYCAHLSAEFSSFGDSVSTEEERMAMLRSGACVLIHPCKSNVVE